MQAEGRRTARSFTESARRAQIVRAAIAVIAEAGYKSATFAQIARRAGLSSTGLISYHFDGRDELIREVVAEILSGLGAHMQRRMTSASSAADALRTYIEANAEYTGSHRDDMKALLAIFLGGGFPYDATTDQVVVSPVAGILRSGQGSGEFREFDPTIMATLVQRAVDGLAFLLDADPSVDPLAYGAEVATVFDLATRAGRR